MISIDGFVALISVPKSILQYQGSEECQNQVGLPRAAVKFWDPKDHVFQFKTAELCPTIEKFSAILGYDLGKKSVAISCDPRYKESLSDALGLPTSITDSMIEGHMVNLRAIISQLIDKRTYGVTDNM